MDLDFRLVQATPDLLPQDLLGAMIYRQQMGEFELRKGAIFTQILLFDEINRATQRTASGLLEAMAERQISIDGNTEQLKLPFFVIATQNPLESQGVFPLPEAQLDRFLVKVKLGYPSLDEEQAIVRRFRVSAATEELSPVLRAEDVLSIQQKCKEVAIHPDVEAYILSIVRTTRSNGIFVIGGIPRASLGFTGMAQALAYIDGRSYVVPDEVKLAVIPVLGHRYRCSRTSREGKDRRVRADGHSQRSTCANGN